MYNPRYESIFFMRNRSPFAGKAPRAKQPGLTNMVESRRYTGAERQQAGTR